MSASSSHEPDDDIPAVVRRAVHAVHHEFDAVLTVDRSVVVRIGDPVEVLIRIDPTAVHVELPTVEWHGPHTPVLCGDRRASFATAELRLMGEVEQLAEAVAAVRAERLAQFRVCAECGERTPPEWLHDDALCSGCAERNHGVVH